MLERTGRRLTVGFAVASRVENRRSNCSLPVVVRRGFRRATAVRFGLVLFPVPAHRTGQADFPHPALGKRLMLAPTEGSQSGVVTGPSQTQNEETLPGTACIPAALHGVYRRVTDAACGAHVDRPHCRLC
jgi:hypothetical protein